MNKNTLLPTIAPLKCLEGLSFRELMTLLEDKCGSARRLSEKSGVCRPSLKALTFISNKKRTRGPSDTTFIRIQDTINSYYEGNDPLINPNNKLRIHIPRFQILQDLYRFNLLPEGEEFKREAIIKQVRRIPAYALDEVLRHLDLILEGKNANILTKEEDESVIIRQYQASQGQTKMITQENIRNLSNLIIQTSTKIGGLAQLIELMTEGEGGDDEYQESLRQSINEIILNRKLPTPPLPILIQLARYLRPNPEVEDTFNGDVEALLFACGVICGKQEGLHQLM